MLCFSSRNMIDKTMCEVLWRHISDFYVKLRVEVAAVSRNRYGVETTVYSLIKFTPPFLFLFKSMINNIPESNKWLNIT
jgi:hypothetical protein